MVTVRFSNETRKSVKLVVEPWASTEVIPAGSKFAVHYPAPTGREDTSYTEIQDGLVRFWCEGETYEVDIDGVRVVT